MSGTSSSGPAGAAAAMGEPLEVGAAAAAACVLTAAGTKRPSRTGSYTITLQTAEHQYSSTNAMVKWLPTSSRSYARRIMCLPFGMCAKPVGSMMDGIVSANDCLLPTTTVVLTRLDKQPLLTVHVSNSSMCPAGSSSPKDV
jgi:hypothetical protein